MAGDIVLLQEDMWPMCRTCENMWPMGRVIDIQKGSNGFVWSVNIIVGTNT